MKCVYLGILLLISSLPSVQAADDGDCHHIAGDLTDIVESASTVAYPLVPAFTSVKMLSSQEFVSTTRVKDASTMATVTYHCCKQKDGAYSGTRCILPDGDILTAMHTKPLAKNCCKMLYKAMRAHGKLDQ